MTACPTAYESLMKTVFVGGAVGRTEENTSADELIHLRSIILRGVSS